MHILLNKQRLFHLKKTRLTLYILLARVLTFSLQPVYHRWSAKGSQINFLLSSRHNWNKTETTSKAQLSREIERCSD